MMAAPLERMKAMRERRDRHGLRELRLVVPDGGKHDRGESRQTRPAIPRPLQQTTALVTGASSHNRPASLRNAESGIARSQPNARTSGNLCRCAAYQNIVAAIQEVAAFNPVARA